MNSKFLINNNNSELIVFFGGWGCDPNQFKHLISNTYDVLMIWDYTEITNVEIPKHYTSYTLIAWSLGVYIANCVLKDSKIDFKESIAINGTNKPIDNKFGIPPVIFEATIDMLNNTGRKKFYKRMCGSREMLEKYNKVEPTRTVEDQKNELIQIQKFVLSNDITSNIFNFAIAGEKDLIFPINNIHNYWGDKVRQIKSPHFIFFDYNIWDEIVHDAKRHK